MEGRQPFSTALAAGLQALRLTCTDAQVERLWRHIELLRAANATVNLTRITDPAGAAVRHVADSLALAAWAARRAGEPLRLLDVGTGGGFPGLPLAICRPAWYVTAVDGTRRKVTCVQGFIEALGLSNCTALQARAEHWDGPAHFDVVLFRAVAAMAECLRRSRRVTRPGTLVVCYTRDPLAEGELAATRTAGIRRHFECLESWAYTLPEGRGTLHRRLYVFARR